MFEYYIIDVCDGYFNRYFDVGIIILGDFNWMNIKFIEWKFGVK